jgi:hypothetical protein
MSWEAIPGHIDRWRWTGPEGLSRHLLVHTDGEMRELHGTTVYVYLAPVHAIDAASPLDGAKWWATYADPGDWHFTADQAEDDLFSWLGAGGYQ